MNSSVLININQPNQNVKWKQKDCMCRRFRERERERKTTTTTIYFFSVTEFLMIKIIFFWKFRGHIFVCVDRFFYSVIFKPSIQCKVIYILYMVQFKISLTHFLCYQQDFAFISLCSLADLYGYVQNLYKYITFYVHCTFVS